MKAAAIALAALALAPLTEASIPPSTASAQSMRSVSPDTTAT